jgi:hypothetical protein
MLSKHFVEGSSAVVEIPDIKYNIFEVRSGADYSETSNSGPS